MDSDIRWLKVFFSEGNDWSLQSILEGRYAGELQAKLENMVQSCIQGTQAFVLPRLRKDLGINFYICGEDRRQLEEFKRVVSAYIGRAYGVLDPRILVASDDRSELAILDRFPHGFSILRIPPEFSSRDTIVQTVLAELNSAVDQFANRPLGLADMRRPTGRILSDFFVAYGRRDGDAAYEYYEELKAVGTLSSQNLISVELQALAAGGRWREVAVHPKLINILNGRMPGRVTEVALRAVQHTTIRSSTPTDFEMTELQEALQGLSPLFMREPDLDPVRQADLWMVWAIGSAACGYSRVLDTLSKIHINGSWLVDLANWAGLTKANLASTDPIEPTIGDEPTLETAMLLLKATMDATERQGAEIFQRLIEFPDEVLTEVKNNALLRSVLEALESRYAASGEIDSWDGWLSSLADKPEQALPVSEVSEICIHWSTDQWNEDSITQRLYDLADSESASEIRNVIPLLREWLLDRELGVSAALAEQMVVMLSVDEIYSIQDLALLSDLISDLVNVPHTDQQYKEFVGAAVSCWERVKSVNSLEHGLEIMDTLLDSVCADEDERVSFWNSLQQFCISHWGRLSDDLQLTVLRTADDAVGSTAQFPPRTCADVPEVEEEQDFSGQRLAIYTLTEGAARRARAVLGELFPGLEVRLNHDKSATTALVNLAKSADYFVFASRSAAHQAFYPVTKLRDDILYPAGKGSSSIVRCFLDFLNQHPATA